MQIPESDCSVFALAVRPPELAVEPVEQVLAVRLVRLPVGPVESKPGGRTGKLAVRPVPRDRAQFLSGFEMKISIPVDSSDQNAQKSQE